MRRMTAAFRRLARCTEVQQCSVLFSWSLIPSPLPVALLHINPPTLPALSFLKQSYRHTSRPLGCTMCACSWRSNRCNDYSIVLGGLRVGIRGIHGNLNLNSTMHVLDRRCGGRGSETRRRRGWRRGRSSCMPPWSAWPTSRSTGAQQSAATVFQLLCGFSPHMRSIAACRDAL